MMMGAGMGATYPGYVGAGMSMQMGGNYAMDPNAMMQQQAAFPVDQGAMQIQQYKNLLDSGAITQEEFDKKKAEILGGSQV